MKALPAKTSESSYLFPRTCSFILLKLLSSTGTGEFADFIYFAHFRKLGDNLSFLQEGDSFAMSGVGGGSAFAIALGPDAGKDARGLDALAEASKDA